MRQSETSSMYRVRLVEGAVEGGRCAACRYAVAPPTPRCPACGGVVEPAAYRPVGTVWASTVVHIQVGKHVPPVGLAYVDLQDGPRVLARFAAAESLAVGALVTLVGDGDDIYAQPSGQGS